MKVVAIVAGALLILSAVTDASQTLVTTRRGNRRFMASQGFYRIAWRTWRGVGKRIDDPDRRQTVLGTFGPISLLGLLVTWVAVLIIGWGLIWWGLRDHVDGIGGFIDAVYYSGVTFLTLGYGDIVPTGPLAQILAVAEAFLGLGIVALVIGFLPVLYGAFSRREVQLLTLDDLTDATTSVGLLELYFRQGELEKVYDMFVTWDHWCADVFDSHTAYPMLMLFRSRQPGQSWLTALGVVTDAAALTVAIVPGAGAREPALLYRRAVRTLESLSVVGEGVHGHHPHLAAGSDDESAFRRQYDRLVAVGFPARPYADAWEEMRRLRTGYAPLLLGFATLLLVEPDFRNHAPSLPPSS
ncbi:MAG: potassium channel family protein [Acidimicrobiia bacterium]